MSNILIEKNKLDILANAISNKSGEPLKLTLDEMVEAVDGIENNPAPTLQAKTYTVDSAGTETITADSGYDGLSEVEVSVPSAIVVAEVADHFFTQNNVRKWEVYANAANFNEGYLYYGQVAQDSKIYNAIPTGTTVTPTESAQTIGGADTMMEGAVTVSAIPSNYVGSGITRRSSSDVNFVEDGEYYAVVESGYYSRPVWKEVPSGTAGTPTATKGTVSNHSVSVTPSVTNTTGYITGGTKTGTAVTVSASELVSGTLNVTSAGTKDVTNYASASIPSGTEGTPTATKGTVSNHSVSVTPSVTNTSGFISGGTKTGTAVSVSASELVSGSETKTENGTYDVTNLAEIVVDVQGGGSSGVQVAVATPQSGANAYVMFGGLLGAPTSFSLINTYNITIDDTPIVSALTFDGTNYVGQLATNLSNANAHAMSTGFSHQYFSSDKQIAVSSENAAFDTHSHYILVYTYGGSASDIHTADVQVGSGATSITFPVTGRPTYWSCVFKSDFGTSNGYQRVIAVANDGTNTYGTYGLCLDSSVHASNQYWTASYSGGNFTISSQSTNAGGYFHQPGYYQLTYIVDESAPSYQTKTVTPTTSQQVVTPDTGYDALSQVTVNAIPNTYVQPTSTVGATTYRASTSNQTIAAGTYHSAAATIAAVSQTNLTADNIKSGTTISISNGQSNIWSVTGTYTGDGGGGGSSSCGTKTMSNSNDQATSIQFTGLSGEPKWFFVRCSSQLTRSSSYSYYYVTAVRYNGTNHYGNYWRRSNGTFYNDTTHYSHTYSNGTLTVSSSASRGAAGGSFYSGSYELVYIY